jgi:hypothetical protein
MRKALFFVLLLVLGGLAVACSGPTPNALRTQSPLMQSPLAPVLTSPISTPAYRPSFKLNPISPGATEVTGVAPTGFTLVIIDVNYDARQLGSGTADNQGKFKIQVSPPPEAGHLIGLTVDLPPEQLNDEQVNQQLYAIRGEGYRFVPNLVTVFDSVTVK